MNTNWTSTYDVTADFMPFRHWIIRAEGEGMARWKISQQTGIPVEQLSATLTVEVAK